MAIDIRDKSAKAVVVVESAQNRKLSTDRHCSATYASEHSCPDGTNGTVRCPLMGAGCYAESNFVGMITRRLNASIVIDTWTIAQQEADGIRALPGKYPLRLHVVGDCPNDESASIVSAAADDYVRRSGQACWTYTHAWQTVSRASWGNVSVLASCQTLEEVHAAEARGFATALVVTHHEKETAYPIDADHKGLPCPQQTGRCASCCDCGLCHKADKLLANKIVILFALHGPDADKAVDKLEK